MKLLICYTSKSNSNSIVSATMAKLDKQPIEKLEIERFNLDKRNIKKYFENEEIENKAEVIYVYNKDLEKHQEDINYLKETVKNLKIVTYSYNVVFQPVRQPGNTLKTRVYYLYDKILYDMKANFEDILAYKVSMSKNEIKTVMVSNFELESPYAVKYITYGNLYESLKDARIHIRKRIINQISTLEAEAEKIQENYNTQMANIEKEKNKKLLELEKLRFETLP